MFQISFKTYNYKDLKIIKKKIENLKKKKKLFNKIEVKKTNFIKSRNKIYTVLKSPHVHKKSREHFNFCFYKMTIFLDVIDLYIFLFFLTYIKTRIKQNSLIKTKICL